LTDAAAAVVITDVTLMHGLTGVMPRDQVKGTILLGKKTAVIAGGVQSEDIREAGKSA